MADKVVIITGASSGIGAALARHLGGQGAKLALAARNSEKLAAVAADCPQAIAIPTDVTDSKACHALVARTIEAYGRVDVLVNNAGQSMLARFDELDDLSLFETLMKVNYFGAVYCTQAALPHLKQSGGLLVAISTLAGETGVPLRTGYSAAKHALQGFMGSLRIELMDSGVDVCIVSPGFVDTQIREHSLSGDGSPLGYNPLKDRNMMSAEEAARIIAQAIASRKREVRMGTRGKMLPLGKLLMPGFVDKLAKRSADHR